MPLKKHENENSSVENNVCLQKCEDLLTTVSAQANAKTSESEFNFLPNIELYTVGFMV